MHVHRRALTCQNASSLTTPSLPKNIGKDFYTMRTRKDAQGADRALKVGWQDGHDNSDAYREGSLMFHCRIHSKVRITYAVTRTEHNLEGEIENEIQRYSLVSALWQLFRFHVYNQV